MHLDGVAIAPVGKFSHQPDRLACYYRAAVAYTHDVGFKRAEARHRYRARVIRCLFFAVERRKRKFAYAVGETFQLRRVCLLPLV